MQGVTLCRVPLPWCSFVFSFVLDAYRISFDVVNRVVQGATIRLKSLTIGVPVDVLTVNDELFACVQIIGGAKE